MKKRQLLIVLTVTIVLGVLVGCGSGSQPLTDMTQDEINEQIFQPALEANILSESWATPKDIDPSKQLHFYSLSTSTDESYKTKDIEKVLSKRFNTDKTVLRQSPLFDAEDKRYNLNDIVADSVTGEITDMTDSEQMSIHYTFTKENGDNESKGEFVGTLKIAGETIDDYAFISNEVEFTEVESPQEEPPVNVEEPPVSTEKPPTNSDSEIPERELEDELSDPPYTPSDPPIIEPDPDDKKFDYDPDAPKGSPANPHVEEERIEDDTGESSKDSLDDEVMVEKEAE